MLPEVKCGEPKPLSEFYSILICLSLLNMREKSEIREGIMRVYDNSMTASFTLPPLTLNSPSLIHLSFHLRLKRNLQCAVWKTPLKNHVRI